MENQTTFSEIMAGYFYKRGSLVRFVEEKYPNDNPRNKARVLMRYQTGERVPSFQDARDLLDEMKYDISDEELLEVLQHSMIDKIEPLQKERFLNRTILNYDEILKKEDLEQEEKILMIQSLMEDYKCKTPKELVIELINEELLSKFFKE